MRLNDKKDSSQVLQHFAAAEISLLPSNCIQSQTHKKIVVKGNFTSCNELYLVGCQLSDIFLSVQSTNMKIPLYLANTLELHLDTMVVYQEIY